MALRRPLEDVGGKLGLDQRRVIYNLLASLRQNAAQYVHTCGGGSYGIP
jgi:hypothetical protein